MELAQAVDKQRSTPPGNKEIPNEVLADPPNEMPQTPAGFTWQPYKFVVVREEATRPRLAIACRCVRGQPTGWRPDRFIVDRDQTSGQRLTVACRYAPGRRNA